METLEKWKPKLSNAKNYGRKTRAEAVPDLAFLQINRSKIRGEMRGKMPHDGS